MDFMKNCSLKWLLVVLFLVPMTLLTADILYSVGKLKNSSSLANQINKETFPQQTAICDIKIDFKDIRLSNTKLSYASQESARAAYIEEMRVKTELLSERIDSIKKTLKNEKDITLIDEIKKNVQEYYTLSLQKENMRDDPAKLADFVKNQTTPKGKMIDEGISTYMKNLQDANEKVNMEINEATNPNTVIICSLIAILIGIAFIYSMYVYIGESLTKLTQKAEDVSKGNIADINTSHMSNESQNEIVRLMLAFSKVIFKIKNIIVTLSKDVEIINKDTKELSQAQKEINKSTEDLLNHALSVNAAIDEMAASSKEIASNCNQAADSSKNATEKTEEGMIIVQNTVETIRHHTQNTQEDAKAVHELGEKTKEITSIISTIQGIADQTNLLALNAAIEAARAGEHGRGFAVVADEVRNLATKTSESTKEITAMVEELQFKAKSANQSISNTVEQMEAVANDTSMLKENFEAILGEVKNVTSQITQIASATEQQTGVANEMANNMSQITSDINEMVAETAQTAVVSQELNDKINDLVGKQVQQFNIHLEKE